MRRILIPAWVVLAVGYSLIPARAASFAFDHQPITVAAGVLMWNQAAINARSSGLAADKGVAVAEVPPAVASPLQTPTCSPTLTGDCISPDRRFYYTEGRAIRLTPIAGPGQVAYPPPASAVWDTADVHVVPAMPTKREVSERPAVPPDWDLVEITFSPLSLSSSEASTGPGREAGVWLVVSCNRSGSRVMIPRGEILGASAAIRWIPDGQRDLLLSRRTRQSPWRIFGGVLKDYGTLGAAAAGIAFSGVGAGAAAGLGAQLLKTSIEKGQKTAEENAVEYRLFHPIPEVVIIEPLACVEHDLLSSLIKGAAKHRGRIGR